MNEIMEPVQDADVIVDLFGAVEVLERPAGAAVVASALGAKQVIDPAPALAPRPSMDAAEWAENRDLGPVTMPVHSVAFVEHARGHAAFEWCQNQDGDWVVRGDADVVADLRARGITTLTVTTKRGGLETVTIRKVGVPFTTAGGVRLVQVHVVRAGRAERAAIRARKAAEAGVVDLAGTRECDACPRRVRALFPAVDRDGVTGWVCVHCDRLEPADRIYGTGLAPAEGIAA